MSENQKTLPLRPKLDTNNTTRAPLRAGWLWTARTLWVMCFVGAILFALYSSIAILVPSLQAPQQSSSDYLVVLAKQVVLAVLVAQAVIMLAGSLFLFWQRSTDHMVLITSAVLMTAGSFPLASVSLVTTLPHGAPTWWLIGAVTMLAGTTLSCLVLLLIYPDGYFYPRWGGWLLLLVIPMSIALPVGFITQGTYPRTMFVVVLLITSIALIMQAARYRWSSSDAQKQQIKWFAYGTALFVLFQASGIALRIATEGQDPLSPIRLIADIIAYIAVFVGWLSPLIALSLAILRYRLWDINFLINRSLVYAGLTTILGVVFAGAFFALRLLLEAVLGSQQAVLTAVISTAIVVLLFNPTRRTVGRMVDQRLYGIHLDYQRAVKSNEDWGRRARVVDGEKRARFGDYTDLVQIGRGGMGEVYRAHHPVLGRTVAIKIMVQQIDQSDELRQRFNRETQTVARLNHLNIVHLHDFGELDGTPFMVMDYIDGDTLSDLIKQRGSLPLIEAAPLLADIAAALDYAHGQGVVHRDVKPSNVMLHSITADASGRTHRAVLMDFGIAKVLTGTTQLTHSGMIGTLDYISPEQVQGAAQVDHRADIYSFGVMTYQVLTGEKPFKHNNPGAMVMAHLMQPPPDPRLIAPNLPAPAAEAILRAMSKQPEHRFATAGAFIDALCANTDD